MKITKTQLKEIIREELLNEGLSVTDERPFGKKGIIIMIDDNGKKASAIFKNKKNADKYNRNKSSDLQALLKLAKNTPYPKAIDEGKVNEAKYKIGAIVTVKTGANTYKGKIENLSPLKIRISPSETMVIPDKAIKSIGSK